LQIEARVHLGSKMRVSLQQLTCLALLFGLRAQAFASDAYSAAFARADAAERVGNLGGAARELEVALRSYPRDYALLLKLAWLHFRLEHYVEAELQYRLASEVSEGAADALIGLGWSLIQQKRCSDARAVLQRLLATTPGDARAQKALDVCSQAAAVHGTLWLQLGGALYRKHPWKDRSGDITAGATLAPYAELQLGGAYRFLGLSATDNRIAGYVQHEGYAQAGYASEAFGALAHGAVIWSPDSALGTSRHVGLSARVRCLGEISLEMSGSFYQDLWVARIAPAWQLSFGAFRLTPGFALQRFARATRGSGSLAATVTWGRSLFWLSGKYGPEYRAAYLSQFVVVNSEDRSEWGTAAGLKISIIACFALFCGYAFNRFTSLDGLRSDLHLLNIGTVLTL
jgi:tetratricopeptide (TPR) repeat protein